MTSADPVLVTGACGLVGRAVVDALISAGHPVLASDLGTDEHRRWAAGLGARHGERGLFRADWADLTTAEATRHLVWSARPRAVVHLAAIIPPGCYRSPAAARAVNVEATRHVVEAVAAAPGSPHLVLASSVAVHGARNPHRTDALLGAETPVNPSDLYGGHKAEAETLVRAHPGTWTILRLGGVLTTTPAGLDADAMDFEGMLPADQRIQTVDVRDVARAFVAAATGPAERVAGRTLMIGGDATHRLRQRQITPGITGALGLEGALPPGRPGDPSDDAAWFATDWMDTAEAQDLLDFQRHSWPAMLAQIRRRTGLRRYLLRLAGPVVHETVRRRPARRRVAARAFADPWGDVAAAFGDPDPEG